jgi:hypothetical protein
MPAYTVDSFELSREQVQAILVQPLTAASVFLASAPRIFDERPPGVVTAERRPLRAASLRVLCVRVV